MPKAAKPRSTKARHSPLSTSDANAPKKQEPADASEEARSSATSGKGKEEKVSKKKVKKEEVEEKVGTYLFSPCQETGIDANLSISQFPHRRATCSLSA